ncbi:MAG: aminomethyl-transferring glycine dehydrogenase [Ignavibacteria bacterium]|nr:aminomethyl-transferring glycine dehydrogenase [Ignavibacteria bacterium]
MLYKDKFEPRHNSLSEQDIDLMLRVVGAPSMDSLIAETVPAGIRLTEDLDLPEALTEAELLAEAKRLAAMNIVGKTYIGMGYYNTITPPVILRNIVENPGWYTQYTPYQAEIAQGRLESLLNYQSMIIDLTKMEIAGASLLDEATAAAEAMHLMFAARSAEVKTATKMFVNKNVHPQTLDVLMTRAEPLNINIEVGNWDSFTFTNEYFGAYLQYPAGDGSVHDYAAFCQAAHDVGALVTVGTDLLALTVLVPPGEFGADVAIGSSQRFGVPLGYGGPHAAFLATREQFKRLIPGRIIGVSTDVHGNVAYRMALQTREQHIRRDKATSNICTAQALLANVAAMYAVYHGPSGLRGLAERVTTLTSALVDGLAMLGFTTENNTWFDTIQVTCNAAQIKAIAEPKAINFRYFVTGDHVGISLDETTTPQDVLDILSIFAKNSGAEIPEITGLISSAKSGFPLTLRRMSSYLTHPVFNTNRSEHELLRYMKRLENKDLSLVHSMIPLGSCTMKLNATAEMMPVTWPAFNEIHPFAPLSQTQGYQVVFAELDRFLCEITGFDACSLQPNAGAQGEYAGLLAIHRYHQANGGGNRNVVLIPASAHGTNPASAVMTGMKVVVVKSDAQGHIDVDDLRAKAEANSEILSALMVTYPSTHGVFEEPIKEICSIIHQHGGLVYMDGANMNAQVGLTSPRIIGADVCHLNLHKTFCIPHGGGGPGMGPICVTSHLAPYLPGHVFLKDDSLKNQFGYDRSYAVSAAPWSSASILLISWAYIRMMGTEGLVNSTKQAILNANYIKSRLEGAFRILYTGSEGRCAHEMIVDMREFKQRGGIEVEDIAKRLMDYGFHAPTVSFPVAGTMMIEPTESENKAELDRFCDAMLRIHEELEAVCSGEMDPKDNPLKNAPHTMFVVSADEWNHPYTRQQAAFPAPWVKERKFWPSVGRVDNAYGDRVLVCTCPPVEAYADV